MSPLKLADYDVAHSLLLGGVGRDFPFTKNETKDISYTKINSWFCSPELSLQISSYSNYSRCCVDA